MRLLLTAAARAQLGNAGAGGGVGGGKGGDAAPESSRRQVSAPIEPTDLRGRSPDGGGARAGIGGMDGGGETEIVVGGDA